MNNEGYKEVYFNEYCKLCKHVAKNPVEEPCNSCLTEPVNLNSHKPVRWEKKEN